MIIRRRHTANFTTIGNVLFNDERLQADEVGIIGYLLSRPHDWEVRRPQLAKRFRYGRKAIKRVIWNGMRFGWIVAQKTKLADGRFFTVYEVRDEPGPDLSDDEIRSALSLGSSEADDADFDDSEDGAEGADPPTPDGGVPERGVPKGYVASIEEATKHGFTKDESTKAVRDFARVISRWPAEHVLSRATAERELLSLTDSDFSDCDTGIGPYLDDCKAANRKICDLTTFIRERRWERFVARAGSTSTLFAVQPGTPQAHRWREYLERAGLTDELRGFDLMMKLGRAYTAKDEWPPPFPPKAA